MGTEEEDKYSLKVTYLPKESSREARREIDPEGMKLRDVIVQMESIAGAHRSGVSGLNAEYAVGIIKSFMEFRTPSEIAIYLGREFLGGGDDRDCIEAFGQWVLQLGVSELLSFVKIRRDAVDPA